MEKYGLGVFVVLNTKDITYGNKIIRYEEDNTKSKEEMIYDINIDNEGISQRDEDLIDLLPIPDGISLQSFETPLDYTTLNTKHFKIVAVVKEGEAFKMVEKEYFHRTFFEALRLKVLLRSLAIDMLGDNQELVDYIVLGY